LTAPGNGFSNDGSILRKEHLQNASVLFIKY